MYENIKIDTLILDVTWRCNLNCAHCYNGGNQNVKDMDFKLIKNIVETAYKYKIRNIYFSGGEPLLHKDFDKMLNLVFDYPYINFGITTNGILLNKDIIKILERLTNVNVQVSLDGSTQEIYEQYRGEGTFESFITNFKLLSDSKIRNKATRTAISKINYKDVSNICNLAIDNGFTPSFLYVANLGNAINNWRNMELSNVQKLSVINKIKNIGKMRNIYISLPLASTSCTFTDGIERQNFSVAPNGDVLTCNYFYDRPIGNLNNEKWEDILQSKEIKELYNMAIKRAEILSKRSECVECEARMECRFGCMGIAYNNNNIYGFDDEW